MAALFASNSFAVSLIPRIGVDIPTSVDYSKGRNLNEDAKLGFNIGAELRGDLSKHFGWGAGLEYNFPRGLRNWNGLSNIDDSDFSFLPVFISALWYPLGDWDKARPYVKVSGGYNLFATNQMGSGMSGSWYWGGGIGVEYKNLAAEFFSSQLYATYNDPDKTDMRYTKMGFTLGYKFKI